MVEKGNRRPDVVLFVNGLPLAVFAMKNPAAENATVHDAFNQLQTYKQEIPCQMILGHDAAVLPGFVMRWEIRVQTFVALRNPRRVRLRSRWY